LSLNNYYSSWDHLSDSWTNNQIQSSLYQKNGQKMSLTEPLIAIAILRSSR